MEQNGTQSLSMTDLVRVQNIVGQAIVHLEPLETKVDRSSKLEVFDDLIGAALDVKTSRPVSSKSGASPVVRVRLEYDDAVIGSHTAAAYLSRLQHHLEHPS